MDGMARLFNFLTGAIIRSNGIVCALRRLPMTETNDKQLPEVILEIIITEQKRASKLLERPIFKKWVADFRQKYIANGFLTPFYARDSRYSRSRRRVSEFGNHILPWETHGKMFHEVSPGWIRNEETWFWFYLTDGQEVISSNISIPDILKIDGVPADLIWQEIIAVMKELQLFGETGGGLIFSPHCIDESFLASIEQVADWHEREDGYLESYKPPKTRYWITQFHTYERYQLSSGDIEIRPAWFHLAKYAFFNAPVQRLPVFYGAFTEEGKLERVRFLDDSLSDRARDVIGKALLGMPNKLKQQVNIDALERERQEMTWWLWRNVGNDDYKRTLSYGEIADIADTSRSSIQTAVERFSRKLKNDMDGHLLGRFLRTAGSLGLGYNMTYKALVQQGLVPAREREIDSFDDLDKLI